MFSSRTRSQIFKNSFVGMRGYILFETGFAWAGGRRVGKRDSAGGHRQYRIFFGFPTQETLAFFVMLPRFGRVGPFARLISFCPGPPWALGQLVFRHKRNSVVAIALRCNRIALQSHCIATALHCHRTALRPGALHCIRNAFALHWQCGALH